LCLAIIGFHAVYTVSALRRAPDEQLLRVKDGARLTLDQVLDDLSAARLIFVGELHDQFSHHEAQLRVVQAFHEAGRPVAMAMEMFRAETQPALDLWVAGQMSLEAFLGVYYDNWDFPWVYYGEILMYAREHGIPLVGLNISQEVVRQVARQGFASLTPEQLGELPPVRCRVDAAYEDFIRRALGMHEQDGRTFVNFCEAQLVWDTAMAVRLVEFVTEHPDPAVVVIAGSGHAWKRGIPEQVAQITSVATRVIVPEIPERLERATVTPEDTDYLWLDLTAY
jgi:uncharacterized iron-regulated protein